MSGTYELRRIAMRAKNAQIRANDIADDLDGLGWRDYGTQAKHAALVFEGLFKSLMNEADRTRDPRGGVREHK